MQSELAVVGQNLFDFANINRGLAQMRGHEVSQSITEHVRRDQSLSRQQFREFGLARGGQIPGQIRAF